MTESAGLHDTRATTARARAADTADARTVDTPGAQAIRRDDRMSRAVLCAAIAAVAVLVLLMPATPLVAFVLLAAVVLGVVAALVRRAEDHRSTGETLERLSAKGYLVLVDRVSPGLTGTIDLLVIGPGGVFVVEIRDHTGRVRIRGDRLVVGGHSHAVASQLRAQVAAVAITLEPVLDGTGASVVPLVCMRRAELPIMYRTVAGIPLLRESQLERRIARSATSLDESTICRLGDLAEATMPEHAHRRATAPSPVPVVATREPQAASYSPEPTALSASMALPSTPN